MKHVLTSAFVLILVLVSSASLRAQTITTRTLDHGSNGDVGQHALMAIVNGNPAMAYYNETDTSLMFARNSAADGSGAWQITTVRSTRDVGTFASLAVVDGNPAICYMENNFATGGLKYVRALDPDGTSWGTPVGLDGTVGAGQHTSLMVVNGNPAVSYYNSSFRDLMYVRAADASGTSWGVPLNLDSTGQVGQNTALEVVDGNPAISYWDESNTNLKFIRATDANGASWSAPVIVDGATSNVGRYSSLKVVDGNPAICYQDTTNADLLYVRASDAGGTAWGVPVIMGTMNHISSARFTSLAVINGRPAVAYYDATFGSGLRYARANDVTGAAWSASVLLSSSIGIYPTLMVVAGIPAISCYDASGQDLEFVRALDADGSGWAVPTTADDGTQSGLVGLHASQAIVAGNPAISYYDDTSDDLKFMRAVDAAGANWNPPMIVDTGGAGIVGQYTSLAVVNGNPAISYYDATNGNLNYVRASNAFGTAWNSPVIVDSTGNVGQHTSLAVVDGSPAISYYDTTNGNLNYVRASDASGATWGAPVPVDTGGAGNVGQYTSLTVVDGNPAISYYTTTNGNLNYVRANDTSGTTWGTPVPVDTGGAGNVGTYTSLRVVNGNPAISYYDETNANLKYARAGDASGTTWGAPAALDSAGTVGSHTSMAVINGNPAISYYDATNDDLKYIRALDTSGTNWGTPLVTDGNGDVGTYTSLVAMGGGAAISYYDIDSGNLMWATLSSPNADSDTDGLLDSWELTYWPSLTGHSALDDFDHDGYVELLELALGLNPTIPNPGGLPGVTNEGGYLTITITKQPGVTYEVQSAGTLLPALPDSFSASTTTVLINNSATLKVRDNTLIGTPPARFIRAQVTAAP